MTHDTVLNTSGNSSSERLEPASTHSGAPAALHPSRLLSHLPLGSQFLGLKTQGTSNPALLPRQPWEALPRVPYLSAGLETLSPLEEATGKCCLSRGLAFPGKVLQIEDGLWSRKNECGLEGGAQPGLSLEMGVRK